MSVLPESDRQDAGAFAAIALGFAIAAATFWRALGDLTPLVYMVTPTLAALVMLVLRRRLRGADAWRELGLTRLGLRHWPLALALAAAVILPGFGLLAALGLLDLPSASVADVAKLAAKLTVGLLLGGLVGALQEEIGWRGFLLARLAPLGAWRAAALTGLVQGIWHMPLMLLTPLYHVEGGWWTVPLFLLTLTLAGPVFAHLRWVSGSVVPVMLCHQAVNEIWDQLGRQVLPEAQRMMDLLAGESGLVVIGVLILLNLWLVRRWATATSENLASQFCGEYPFTIPRKALT